MTNRRSLLAGIVGLVATAPLRATEPPLRPRAAPDEVALWTSAALAPGLATVVQPFEQAQGVRVRITARGSDLAMAALYTGGADMALIGRPATDSERQAFEWVRQYPVAEMALAADRLPGGPAPVRLMVHRGNPVSALSMEQIGDLLLSPAPRRWADLGVPGALGAEAVRIHMPTTDSGTGRWLRQTLVKGRAQLAWPRIDEHADDAIAAAVAHDPAGIGLGAIITPAVVVVPLEVGGAPLVAGQPDYPLARRPYLYLETPLAEARAPVSALANFLSGRAA